MKLILWWQSWIFSKKFSRDRVPSGQNNFVSSPYGSKVISINMTATMDSWWH